MIEHEMNGSKITKGIGEYVRLKTVQEKLRADHLVMSRPQWEKIVRMYAEDGLQDQHREFVSLPVELTKHIAESEIHYLDKKNEVIAKIVGLER